MYELLSLILYSVRVYAIYYLMFDTSGEKKQDWKVFTHSLVQKINKKYSLKFIKLT
jgi:hypothetical protein